ncbi:uncharacterized protein LOC111047324 [Nilaparvata lugens]|uniref:uncharacterized protein LOC111047324 n=1 Tax=Nilaparvata lugens TaxID=108931 RepID=UPI00193DF9BE|nr:uncharacterized protein LOC111047324 [Nilaparvata lugens]
MEEGGPSGTSLVQGTTRPRRYNFRNRNQIAEPEGVEGNSSNESTDQGLEEVRPPPALIRVPQPENRPRRMRWSREMNAAVIRAYYLATKIETDRTQYRDRLMHYWKRIMPQSELTAQRIADQVRVIKQRRFLTEEELACIREEVHNQLFGTADNEALENEEAAHAREEAEIERDTLLLDGGAGTALVSEERVNRAGTALVSEERDNNLESKIENVLLENVFKYKEVAVECRPMLKKVPYNRKTLLTVEAVNKTLAKHINEINSIADVTDWIYCGALTVFQELGMKISFRKARKGNTNNSGAKKKSKWRIRIEGKIGDLRRKIGILTSYLRDPEKASLRQKRLVDEIVVQHIGFAQQNKFNETLALQMNKFKQRLAALANRCRRYTEAESRRHQATLFSNDERKYYKLLNSNEHGVVQHPGVEDMEKFWKDIWQEPVMHNENTYWIDQVKSKMRDLAGMPQCVISTEDVSIAVKKSHNWKAPGPDGIQNYWLKNFSSLHSKIAGCFNDLLQQRSEIPVGFASGLTFMIPKKEGNLSPGDYRPITCLNSTYKLMTSTLASKIDSHITLNKIMATEQLGCRKGAKGCKELLILDSFIAGQASAKQRNVSIAWIDYAKALTRFHIAGCCMFSSSTRWMKLL